MKRYLYIVALKELTCPDLKFRHAFVEAKHDAAAYDVGFEAVGIGPNEGRVNDYAVDLSEVDDRSLGKAT